MNLHITFARLASSIITSIFLTLFLAITRPFFDGSVLLNILIALILSGVFSSILILFDALCRKCHLKIFNTLIIGLIAGIFLGKAFTSIFDTVLQTSSLSVTVPYYIIGFAKSFLYLLGIHLGIVTTLAYGEELHISIPFIRFSEIRRDKKDIILDDSILSDPRIIDFLSTGILNNRLVLPTFIIRNLQEKLENSEDHLKSNARKLLAVIEKLQSMKNLDLKENETDFTDITDTRKKVLRLAKITKSNILIADGSKLNNETPEIQHLNLNDIASSLKNVMTTGENIEIKVQRYGKEPNQGVGYLEDGTMVVINNGGNFLGEVIDTKVISAKQTTAGRIIFTNALVVEDEDDQQYAYNTTPAYEHRD